MKILNIQRVTNCIIYTIFLTTYLAACDAITVTPVVRNGDFDGGRALASIQEQLTFGERNPGSEAHDMVGDWIIAQLGEQGWSVEEQIFSYREFQGRNIIGKGGSKEGEWVILGAHYDTRPIADRDKINTRSPVPGANDGGSGVAVLLELARVLPPDEITKQVWLVFFDLEDSGGIDGMDWIVGSTYFAQNLEVLPDQVIIVDMVGDADLQLYYELNSDPDLRREIWDVAIELGYDSFIPVGNHSMIDDHTPFIQLGVPAVDIIDFDYPHWHTTQDTLDKVSSESLEQVGQTLQKWMLTK